MTTGRFFNNPHFLAYARLLRRLHELIRVGCDETPEGEFIRDQMDGPAAYLTDEEVNCLNAISADFYTIGAAATSPKPVPTDSRRRLQEAIDAREKHDFARALDLLRQNQAYLDSAVAAFMRGRIWSQAGETEIASDFYRHARSLDAVDANADLLWLDALARIAAEEELTGAKG